MEEKPMTGMGAPMADAPMADEMPMDDAEMPMDEEEVSKFDMETLMGNFMDMPEERRQLATRLLASPAVTIFDEIVGEPVMARLVEQLGTTIEVGQEGETDAGIMSPMADEDIAPPV